MTWSMLMILALCAASADGMPLIREAIAINYHGAVVNGQPEGNGRADSPDGISYVGDFHDGRPAGRATLLSADAEGEMQELYEGGFKGGTAKNLEDDPLYEQLDTIMKQSEGGKEGHSNQLPEEMEAMNLLAADPRINTICQTGFNAGHSALRWLLNSKPDAKVYSFDIGSHPYSRPASELLSSQFPGRHTITWGDSTQTLPAFKAANPKVKCNLVFVDGGHTYEVAIADLKNFMGMADPSYHVLMMDDTPCKAHWCIGPQKAWKEVLASGDVVQTNATEHAGRRGFSLGRYMVPGAV